MPDEEFDHVAFMKDPLQWPHLVLPVKRAPFQIGILLGESPTVFLENMFDVGRLPPDQVEQIKYESYEACYADGWRVD